MSARLQRVMVITLMLADGLSVKVVGESAGHASEAFTMARYQHVTPGMQQATTEHSAARLAVAQAPGR